MNVVAIIQARMGSERLPGKILMDISGRPMLWHVVNRTGYSNLINKVVVATTQEKKDDAVEKFCRDNSIDFFRGSEKDVLDRYYKAATLHKADAIVRITADCPLIDSNILDKGIDIYLSQSERIEGVTNIIKRTFPRGLDTEIISMQAMETIWQQAKKDYQREHPTMYAYEHPDRFKLINMENDSDLSGYRWTVDEADDLKLVREIYKRLYIDKHVFFMDDIIKLFSNEPSLHEVNKSIKQKEVIG